MKIKAILITTDAGAELEFNDLEIQSLSFLDPWVNGQIVGKVKANGLSIGAQPVSAAPAPPAKQEIELPEPNPSHPGLAKRNEGRGQTLYMLQYLAKKADQFVRKDEIMKYMDRAGFRNTNSVSVTLQQAVVKYGFLEKRMVGDRATYKITKAGIERAQDPRLVRYNTRNGKPTDSKPVHVHVGEGVVSQKN